MSSTYIEFMEKAQAEFLNGLKQAQDLNLSAIASLKDLVAAVPVPEKSETNGNVTIPTPTELVERTFAFTNRILETRKAYILKLAELADEAQKQFVDAAKRVTATN
jgi:hypothetical protein